jgi:hypothetical protein
MSNQRRERRALARYRNQGAIPMSDGRIQVPGQKTAVFLTPEERQAIINSQYRAALLAALPAVINRAKGNFETGAIDYKICAAEAQAAALAATPLLLMSVEFHPGPSPAEKPGS